MLKNLKNYNSFLDVAGVAKFGPTRQLGDLNKKLVCLVHTGVQIPSPAPTIQTILLNTFHSDIKLKFRAFLG